MVSEVMSLKGFKVTREAQVTRAEEEAETCVCEQPGSGSGSGSVSVAVSPGSALSEPEHRAGAGVVGVPPAATASLPSSPQLQPSPLRRSETFSTGKRKADEAAREKHQDAVSEQQPLQQPAALQPIASSRLKTGIVSDVNGEAAAAALRTAAATAAASRAASGPGGPGGPGGPARWKPAARHSGLSVSNASSTSTLVNGGTPGSPAPSTRCWSRASGTSGTGSSRTATPTNLKESKDRRNRERLLRAAGPTSGSEFSLGPDTEMELDYYDYNVHNACAAPGSLLGMDPAYLLWIPPFTPGSWEEEDGGGSEVLGPEDTELQELSSGCQRQRFVSQPLEERALVHTAKVTDLNVKETDDETDADVDESSKKVADNKLRTSNNKLFGGGALTLQELSASPRRLSGRLDEKETTVVKSPSDQRLLYRLNDEDDDIRFADDGEDDADDIIFPKVDPKTVPLLGKRDLNV